MQETRTMEEKLALWKANKKTKGYIKTSQTQPLKVKTNAGRVKVLDNPKTVLKKEENLTRILPENVIQSALSIVSRIETPSNQMRVKPLPSPHLLTKVYKSTETQTTSTVDYNQLMILYQEKVQQVQDLSRELDIVRQENKELEKEKNLEILKVVESNEELQGKLLSLKTKYDQLERQGNKDLLELQENFLQELQEKSELKEQVQRLLLEKKDMENENKEYQALVTEMETVVTESDQKDEEILKLQIQLEESQEQILALEVQIFKKDEEFSEFQDDFLLLKTRYDDCLLKMESFEKENFNQETQTKQVYMESIFTQTSQINQSDDLTKHNALLRMNNSLLSQKLQEAEKIYQMKIVEMKQQMDNENQKWQEIEMSQATMHRKLIDALEKTVAKNKELKKELEKKF